ncbi:bifunctional metallophosphatase/5'-nucleotidase [Alteribacillus sp. HJP-4]|uniref:bifunctional metallophosphatase/5'-nucleotidase n=1 Tax=Alteribacillus sp. HJP-4 TaxID=2775394 RepID=UPI0035CCEAF9
MTSIIPLHIYHTNDLHSELSQWPSVVSYMKSQRSFHEKQGETALFFDLGDHTDRVHPITEATKGKANVRLLNEAGIHHITIGNNEGITFSKEELDELYDEASFTVLLANLFDEKGNRPRWAEPYDLLRTKEGLRIGLIGLTVPFYPFYKELGWDVQDPFKWLPELLEKVKEQSDIVILLSHLGYPDDEEIARKFNGIDVILGAHTHHLLKQAVNINNTLIAQCGKNCYYAGEIKLLYDQDRNKVIHSEGAAVSVRHERPSPETKALLASLGEETDKLLEERIAHLSREIAVSWTEPSEFAKLLTDGVKEWCGAEIAMLNSGLLLDSLPSGPVTRKDIHRLCPHPVNPCLVHVKGSVLKETIAAAFTEKMIHLPLKGLGFRGVKLGRMEFSGMTVELDELSSYVKQILIGSERIDPKKEYKLATADMFTFGPLYPGLAQCTKKKYFMPETMRDVLAYTLSKQYG